MLTDPSLVLENIQRLSDAAHKQYRDLQEELAGLEERTGGARPANVAAPGCVRRWTPSSCKPVELTGR
jgi:hypothetical protein